MSRLEARSRVSAVWAADPRNWPGPCGSSRKRWLSARAPSGHGVRNPLRHAGQPSGRTRNPVHPGGGRARCSRGPVHHRKPQPQPLCRGNARRFLHGARKSRFCGGHDPGHRQAGLANSPYAWGTGASRSRIRSCAAPGPSTRRGVNPCHNRPPRRPLSRTRHPVNPDGPAADRPRGTGEGDYAQRQLHARSQPKRAAPGEAHFITVPRGSAPRRRRSARVTPRSSTPARP